MSQKRPKNRQKWPKCALFVSNPAKTKKLPYLGLRGSKPRSEDTYSTRNPPLFVVPKASESPKETPTTPYPWSLCGAGGQLSPRTVGANGGCTVVPGAKKMIFFKVVPRPLGMLKQVFLGHFEPVVARSGPWKIPKCLEKGRFKTKNGSKLGKKRIFRKVILDHLGCSNKGF